MRPRPDAKGADRTEENAANHATTGIGFPRVGALHVFTAAGDASTDLFNTVVHIRQPHMYANQRLGRSVRTLPYHVLPCVRY